ncbi:tumor necrosis factor receptor superfamily member 1B-like isoform X2 [Paramormyrops kingsleyae]|uniref:tumor necrosis factor receptor superfamily member 1B-like isoform X2 n=1 Tax=Paramormyrops kingsleyae TaxID=1676925 RepID=UPI000CD66764|nr:tumor necrosis factor receptor superfamily member 1B-like isoform X2 [Paramormyrops kingsleyae]
MFGKIFYLLFGVVARHVENEVSALPVSSNSSKNCTKANQYLDMDLNLCCEMCAPGTRLKMRCSHESDTVCEACQPGFYSEKMNYYPNCFRCPQCREDRGLQYAQECTASSPAVCMCKEGMFCTFRGHDHQCKECRQYTLCAPGHGISLAGTSDSDVRCMSCPMGTFSDTTSYTQRCQLHTDCSSQGRDVLQLGNDESDTKCGPSVSPPPAHDPSTAYTSTAVTLTSSVTHYAGSSLTNASETVSGSHITNSQSIPWVIVGAVTVPAIVAVLIFIAWTLSKKRAGTSSDGMPPFLTLHKGLGLQKGGPSSVLKSHLLGHAQPHSSSLHSSGKALLGPQSSITGGKSLTSSSLSQFPDSCGEGHGLVESCQSAASP